MDQPIVISLSLSLSRQVLEAMKAYQVTDAARALPKHEAKGLGQLIIYLEQKIAQAEPAPVETQPLL